MDLLSIIKLPFSRDEKRLRAFICYASKDRASAKLISKCLASLAGFVIFLADDTLDPSDNFHQIIINELSKADYIIPLVSRDFLCSGFANQELGIAVIKNKRIYPISLDGKKPGGLIDHIHAYKCSNLSKTEFLKPITNLIILPFRHAMYLQYKRKAINSLLYALSETNKFRNTSSIVQTIIKIDKFYKYNPAQLKKIIQFAKDNPSVYGEKLIFDDLTKFLQERYNLRIDKQ